ncbi:MAG: ABC transporter ATP-binding protein [Halobacteriales archaeon SW_9_67_24]|nr:MAG: ABC transporter ATP-binding protein [Halobacteriales archaeon SW_9_67_24]
MYAIETTDLTKRYDSTTAVEDLDLAIPEGVVYGFLGPNGAGKTTTMRMLTTLTKPTSGSAAIAGHSVTTRDDVVGHIGYLPEEPPLYDEISTYSKGMKQKTGIIQALLHDPDVVFLDEPTSGLDPRAARTVRNTIAELVAGDTTVFLSTHILPVVEELANEVGVLYEGELVAEGPPDALTERMETGAESTLEDVFLEVTGGREDAAPEHE